MSSIKLKHSGGNSVSLNPPTSAPTSSEVAFKLPTSDGSDGQFLSTNGSGQLAFSTVSVPSAFVTGMIILWSGAANAIPTGFVLCDGNNSTPNLSGKFVVGYHASNGDYDVNDTGGAESITLSESQIPSHYHYAFRSGNAGQLRNGSNLSSNNYPGSGTGAGNLYETYNITARNEIPNVGRTSNAGSTSPHENRPPFYALCYIMKS